MRVSIASEPAPGHRNEDFVGATGHAAVLLDGVGLPGVDDGGCRHSVEWYVSQLGTRLLAALTASATMELADVLAEAIAAVADLHRDTCDLSYPGTPSSTVVAVRLRDDLLDCLVLADSVLLLETQSGVQVISDDRETVIGRHHRSAMDAEPNSSAAHHQELKRYVATLRSYRNRPGGFWVAGSDPAAAAHSLNGTVAVNQVRSLMLLSDGASRLVDRFGVRTWPELVATVAEAGPRAIIDAVRAAERSDVDGRRWPRGKTYDDASIAYCDRLRAIEQR